MAGCDVLTVANNYCNGLQGYISGDREGEFEVKLFK